MNLLEAIFMGLLQGITEFLPVSSSGHLTIFKNLFGLKEVSITFDLMLHMGTLIAVFVVYWKDILQLIKDGIGILIDCVYNISVYLKYRKKRSRPYRKIVSNAYRKFALLVIVATIPTGIIGLTFEKALPMDNLGLLATGICLLITSVLLLLADQSDGGKKTPNTTSYTNGFVIGIVQGMATLPGISRSGSTITACLLSKFDKKFAVKFSFIMSIPAILGANILSIKDIASESLSKLQMVNYTVGTLVAAVVGYICIKTMLFVVKERKFKYFSYYCMAIGVFAMIAHFV